MVFIIHCIQTKGSSKEKRRTIVFEADTTDESAVESADDDDQSVGDDDVDWTPGIHKRLKRTSHFGPIPIMAMPKPMQPPTGAPTCRCKVSCSTKRCACFKADGRCSDSCKCNESCENRELPQPESTTHDDEVSDHLFRNYCL